jgi:hypothetical protein
LLQVGLLPGRQAFDFGLAGPAAGGGRAAFFKTAAALVAVMLLLPPAGAQGSARFMTAAELHLRLSAPELAAREAGRHYVLGVVDALALARDPRACLGPGVAATQLVEVVAAQLRARPDLHRFNAASVVREAIAVEFPCV